MSVVYYLFSVLLVGLQGASEFISQLGSGDGFWSSQGVGLSIVSIDSVSVSSSRSNRSRRTSRSDRMDGYVLNIGTSMSLGVSIVSDVDVEFECVKSLLDVIMTMFTMMISSSGVMLAWKSHRDQCSAEIGDIEGRKLNVVLDRHTQHALVLHHWDPVEQRLEWESFSLS